VTAVSAPAAGVARRSADPVDLSLHGLARLRLLDATPSDVAVVVRQVGPLQVPPEGDADLVVRFVDRLPAPAGERLLGAREAAFSEDGFVVLRSKHKARARVSVPLHRAGMPGCEVVCERGVPAVPLLVPLLNLAVLARGALPLHACAFRTAEGVGVVATGWSKGGKTEALLAFCQQGATYVGDEWVYLPGDGTAAGIPEPIRVWDWHLDSLPGYRQRLRWRNRVRLAALRGATTVARGFPAEPRRLSRLADRVAPLLEAQAHVDVFPTKLFGVALGPLSTSVDRLFLVMSADRPDVAVTPIEPNEVAARMAASLAFERLDLQGWYLRARYAHPEAAWSNPLLEGGAEARERELLERFLAGVPTWVVEHPYPVDLSALHGAMAPLCRTDA
jgi:hypothetical protein